MAVYDMTIVNVRDDLRMTEKKMNKRNRELGLIGCLSRR